MESQEYKKSGISIKKALTWAGVIAVGIVVVIIIMNSLSSQQKDIKDNALNPDIIELRDLRAREIETLTSYKMLDEFNSVVQIPIERAMQLLADEAFEKQMKNAK